MGFYSRTFVVGISMTFVTCKPQDGEQTKQKTGKELYCIEYRIRSRASSEFDLRIRSDTEHTATLDLAMDHIIKDLVDVLGTGILKCYAQFPMS